MDNYSIFIHTPVNEWRHTYLSLVQSACGGGGRPRPVLLTGNGITHICPWYSQHAGVGGDHALYC